jgi:CheY-like chemotaxis protein
VKQKHSVLWIEDGARYDLVDLAAPVIIGGYDLVVAENAADGITRLKRQFEVIIVDIRIPPADPTRSKPLEDEEEWVRLYARSGNHKVSARLGRDLLYTILAHQEAKITRPAGLEWIRPEMIGILTVESYPEISEDLEKLGITAYDQKQAETSPALLLDLVERVLEQQNHQTQPVEGG